MLDDIIKPSAAGSKCNCCVRTMGIAVSNMDDATPEITLMTNKGHNPDRVAISAECFNSSRKERFFFNSILSSRSGCTPTGTSDNDGVVVVVVPFSFWDAPALSGRNNSDSTTLSRLPATANLAPTYKSPCSARYPPNAGPTVAPIVYAVVTRPKAWARAASSP